MTDLRRTESVLYVADKIRGHLDEAVKLVKLFPRYHELCAFDLDLYDAQCACTELVDQLHKELRRTDERVSTQ